MTTDHEFAVVASTTDAQKVFVALIYDRRQTAAHRKGARSASGLSTTGGDGSQGV